MKCPQNCILWNALKEKFYSVSLSFFVFRLFKEEKLKVELFVVLPLINAKKLQRYYRFLIIWVSVYGMSLDLASAALLVCCLCIYFVRATVF